MTCSSAEKVMLEPFSFCLIFKLPHSGMIIGILGSLFVIYAFPQFLLFLTNLLFDLGSWLMRKLLGEGLFLVQLVHFLLIQRCQ
jgi:hypothetical protein